MNDINENREAGKQAYENVSCSVTEVETQGVLCASSDGGILTGGLSMYGGSAL